MGYLVRYMTNPDANAKVKRLRVFSMLAAVAVLAGATALPVSGRPVVPLPKPRPAEAPRPEPQAEKSARPAQDQPKWPRRRQRPQRHSRRPAAWR